MKEDVPLTPLPVPKSSTVPRMGCLLWQDVFLLGLLISQLRALGWELNRTAAVLLAQETGLAPQQCWAGCGSMLCSMC